MKIMTNIKTLAALLMAGAAFTACSSSDEIIEQPANPTAPKVYTMVIKASKGGDATTRALSLNGKTLNACWSGNETIEVYQKGEKLGTATAAYSTDGNTTITATLNPAPDPTEDLNFYLGGQDVDFTGQVGLLTGTGGNSISEKYDYANDNVGANSYTVDNVNNTVNQKAGSSIPLEFGAAQQAIIKFTLKNSDGSALPSNPTAFTVTDGTSTVELTSIPASTYTANGDGVLYVAFPASGSAKTITLTATVGSDTYTYTKSAVTFYLRQYYEITVNMTKQAAVGHALSSAVVGEVVGSDGLAYAGASYNNLPTGVTAVAKVCYVDGSGNGLALALHDEGAMDWNSAVSACENHTPAIAGGTWKLATQAEWNNMITANNGAASLRDGFTSVGGDNLTHGNLVYLSSTDVAGTNGNMAHAYDFNYARWQQGNKTYAGSNARACLAFTTTPTPSYTMAADATTADKGKLICTDGHIHAYNADAECTATRVAMIIYLGTTGHATYTHGLALALADEGSMDWSAACTACNTTKNTDTPVTDAAWLLASQDQWNYLMGTDGAGSYSALRDGFTSVDGDNLQSDFYWSSTETASSNACDFYFKEGGWNNSSKSFDDRVRACLAF